MYFRERWQITSCFWVLNEFLNLRNNYQIHHKTHHTTSFSIFSNSQKPFSNPELSSTTMCRSERKEIVIKTDSRVKAANILWHNYSNVGNGNIFLSSHSFWVNKIEYTVEIWVCSTNPKSEQEREKNFFNYRPRGETQTVNVKGTFSKFVRKIFIPNQLPRASLVFHYNLVSKRCQWETRETQVTFHLKKKEKKLRWSYFQCWSSHVGFHPQWNSQGNKLTPETLKCFRGSFNRMERQT